MKEIYEHIRQQLQNVTGLHWVDFDLGQLDTGQAPVSYPCALIGFTDAMASQQGQWVQNLDTTINIRVAFRTFERTHSKTNISFRDKGLEHLDLLQAIYAALHGTEGETFSPLKRTGYSNQQRADLRVYNIKFSTTLYDCDAQKPLQKPDINPDLEIEGEIK